jgi:chemotaxis protein MotB
MAVRNRRQLLSDHDGTREIWPAFTDVMSSMALIMFVLVLLAYVQNLISEKRQNAYLAQIGTFEQQLRLVQAELMAGKAQLATSQSQVTEQQALIANSNQQLGILRSQLQSIAVLRVSVLNKLKSAIEAELAKSNTGTHQVATIGDNGDIAVNESLVFEYNSFALKEEAKPVLDSLAKALGNLLADAELRANIDAIVIQGHTDERGSTAFNWDLSAKRATAVLQYLFHSNKILEETYGSFFAASAFSKFRPVNPEKSEAAYQQNRRIEISVVPKDANIRKVIDEYVQGVNPALAPPPPAQPAPQLPTPAP